MTTQWAVADNTLTIKQKSILPVSKTRQDKSLFRLLSDTYLPPAESGFVCHPEKSLPKKVNFYGSEMLSGDAARPGKNVCLAARLLSLPPCDVSI